MSLAWEKRPEETQEEYQLFVAYRELSPEIRSNDAEAIRLVATQTGKSVDLIESLFNKHQWKSRMKEYDDYKTLKANVEKAILRELVEILETMKQITHKLKTKSLDSINQLKPHDVLKAYREYSEDTFRLTKILTEFLKEIGESSDNIQPVVVSYQIIGGQESEKQVSKTKTR